MNPSEDLSLEARGRLIRSFDQPDSCVTRAQSLAMTNSCRCQLIHANHQSRAGTRARPRRARPLLLLATQYLPLPAHTFELLPTTRPLQPYLTNSPPRRISMWRCVFTGTETSSSTSSSLARAG